MRLFRIPLAALALMAGAALPSLAGEKAVIEKIISVGREDNQVMDHLDVLSNRIGPRLTSSGALQNACEWARDKFKELGLENAHLEEWGAFPVGFNNHGQPINIQLLGRAWDDGKLVGMAYAFEEVANAAGQGHVEATTAPPLAHDGRKK